LGCVARVKALGSTKGSLVLFDSQTTDGTPGRHYS
jgi:hypothetical protein